MRASLACAAKQRRRHDTRVPLGGLVQLGNHGLPDRKGISRGGGGEHARKAFEGTAGQKSVRECARVIGSLMKSDQRQLEGGNTGRQAYYN